MTDAIDEILRGARARVVAALVRSAGGLDAAEDAFQAAALVAVERWPSDGVPDTPAAWLTTVAKNHVRDVRRRRAVAEAKAVMLIEDEAIEESVDAVQGDQLRLVFTCCHPALPLASQVALTLKVVCGLTTAEIARALLSTEATVAQRIVRAKRAIEEQKLPYEIPERSELPARLAAVLAVIYAVFSEGHTSTSGALMRLDLQAEALFLARLLADLLPERGEVFGLLSLLAFSASRARTRIDAEGAPIELAHQDRSTWDRALVDEGAMALMRARRLGPEGSYALQAEIAAQHALAAAFDATDFGAIVDIYDRLLALTGSPIVALHRAVAVAMIEGPRAGLDALAPLEEALAQHHLFFAVRAELTRRAGGDGRSDDERALALTTNEGERTLLLRRLRGAH